jgi:hypothetical protein
MSETAINHTIKYQSSQFDSLKSSASSKKNMPDDKSYQSSFDTYFSKKNISKETQKPDKQEKPNSLQSKNTAVYKKNAPFKNDSTIKTELQKQVSSLDNQNNTNDTEVTDNNPITETTKENSKTEATDTKDKSETTPNALNMFLIDLTQTIQPLPIKFSENQSDIGLIEVENQIVLTPNSLQTAILTDIALTDLTLLENNGFNLEDEDLLTEEIGNDDTLSLLSLTDTRKDGTLIDSFLVNNTGDKNTANQPTIQTATGLNFYNNAQTIPYINIQKATPIENTQSEVVAQIPLQNDLSLNITKDSDNPNKIGINLEPAGMGEVELVIENNKDNSVIAIIRSDKPEILDQLRKETASLERYLSEAGLNLGGNGLGFEHKSHDDTNQKKNAPNDMLTASIAETTFGNSNNRLINATEQLYATLERQSIQTGLDIRL